MPKYFGRVGYGQDPSLSSASGNLLQLCIDKGRQAGAICGHHTVDRLLFDDRSCRPCFRTIFSCGDEDIARRYRNVSELFLSRLTC